MKALIVSSILLTALCCLDIVRGHQFQEDFNDSINEPSFAATIAADYEKQDSIDRVEEALSSRWTQWGAVGIMLSLFTYIITIRDPRQAEKKDTVIKEFRDSYLGSLESRDKQYLDHIESFRASLERNADRHYEISSQVTIALVRLSTQLDGARSQHKDSA